MNTRVRDNLIEVARKKGIIHYQELCNACGLKLNMRDNPDERREIGAILDAISRFEHQNERPLLSAIVLRKGDSEEGEGFFKLCQDLGLTSDWKRLKKDDVFIAKEISKCHEFWNNPSNYKKFK